MTAVDDAIERAEEDWRWVETLDAIPPSELRDRNILAAEVKKMRRFIPPDGWHQFGTHANCRPMARIEMSDEVGEDGLPLWERPVTERPHIYGEETL